MIDPSLVPAWSKRDYVFSNTWFDWSIEAWTRLFADLKGRPGLGYLEVGTFEGRSLFWMMEHVLTDPSSRATAVDIWAAVYEGNFLHNLRASGCADRITLMKGRSRHVLRGLPLSAYDIVYLDGNHSAAGTIQDIALTWDLLKPNGLFILDDYKWDEYEPRFPKDAYPRAAVDLFLMAFGASYELIAMGDQVVVRKRPRIWNGEDACDFALFGRYAYLWYEKQMVDLERGEKVPTSPDEIAVLDEYIAHMKLSYKPDDPDNPVRRDPRFSALMTRLGMPELTR